MKQDIQELLIIEECIIGYMEIHYTPLYFCTEVFIKIKMKKINQT